MISFQQLVSDAADGRFDTLIEDALHDGPRIPLPVRLRLSDAAHADVCGLSLALTRLCTVTHQPGPRARILLTRLLEQLEHHEQTEPLGPAAASVAINALLTLRQQIDLQPREVPLTTAQRHALDQWVDRLLHTLFLAQQASLLADRDPGLVGDPLDSVIVAWQLSHQPEVLTAIRMTDLTRALREPGVRHTPGVDELLHRTRLTLSPAA